MSSRALPARPPAAAIAIAGAALLACFTDGGLHTATDAATATSSTADPTTSTTVAATTGTSTGATTTAPLTTGGDPVCGDGVLEGTEQCDDGNLDDTDACLAGCVPASCGDGVVWIGAEECDDGPANHPTHPGVCRPTCKQPACGDGGLYVGPFGPPIVLAGGDPLVANDDAPRTLGVAGDGSFVVAWGVDGLPLDRMFVQRLAANGALIGDAVEVQPQFLVGFRDLVLAVNPGGDYALAWENLGDPVRVRVVGVQADLPADDFPVTSMAVTQDAPSIALGADGRLVVAFLQSSNNLTHVRVRHFPSFVDDAAPPDQLVSEHVAGSPTSPTVALHADGSFVVAWGDPGGAIFYRRFTADAQAGPIVDTGLRTGGGAGVNSKPWSAVAIRPNDAAVVVAGVDGGGQLRLTRFDGAGLATATTLVADTDARFVPNVDITSDPWDNLAVAWTACGAPGDPGTTCSDLPSTSSVRWFFADLTPLAPATAVTTQDKGQPAPLSLAVAPSGATAVSHVSGDNVLVYLSPVNCP